jgi:hypothetical protein
MVSGTLGPCWRGGLVLLAIDWLECEYKKTAQTGGCLIDIREWSEVQKRCWKSGAKLDPSSIELAFEAFNDRAVHLTDA